MCAYPELGVAFASDAVSKHGLETLESWVVGFFASRGLRFEPGALFDPGKRERRYRTLARTDPALAARGPNRHADLDVSGVFSVGGCGCGWRGILDVRNGVLDLFEAHEVKRVRFGNPWFDSLDAPQVVPLSELGSKTFDDLDQTLVDVRRVSGDPRPTRRLRDLADIVHATQ